MSRQGSRMHASLVTIALALLTTVAVRMPTTAQNWPRFRGPSGSGVADSRPLPIAWDGTTGKGVLWKTPVPGVGHSSPVVWGDRIFLTTSISSARDAHYDPKDAGIDPSKDVAVHQWRVIALD